MGINYKTFTDKLDASIKALTLVAAVSFFLGFLVVNLYLARFGFWDFNFLKIEYISAGLLLLFYLFVGLVGFVVREILISRQSIKPSQSRLKLFFTKFLTALIPFFINGFFFFIPVDPHSWNKFRQDLSVLIAWSLFLYWMFVALRYSYRRLKINSAFPKLDEILADEKILRIIWVPFLVLTNFVFFCTQIYPLIPRAWGGGKPTSVVITLTDSSKFSSPLRTEMIYQSPEALLVVVNNNSYLFKQASVSDIQYLDQGPDFARWFSSITNK